MSLPGYVPGLPRIASRVNATHRIVFKGGQFDADFPGGAIIDGTTSRDPGNTGDIDVLRPGLLMGKIAATGQYAPSILGVTTGAVVAGATSISVAAAVVTELVRRIGSSGAFRLVGPPSAGGIVAEEAVTYSAATGTTITVTALTNAFIAGSFIMPDDGSEDILTLIPDGYGVKVTDTDGSTSLDVPFERMPIGGILTSEQLLPAWPSDTSLRAWLVSEMNRHGSGKFIFDHLYLA